MPSDIKLDISADVLLKKGKINTTEFENALAVAIRRLPTPDVVLNPKLAVKGIPTADIRKQFARIAKDSQEFLGKLTDKGLAKKLSEGNLFSTLANSAKKNAAEVRKSVTGVSKTFDRLDSLMGARTKSNVRFAQKTFAKDLAAVTADPSAFLNLPKQVGGTKIPMAERKKDLQEFAALQKQIASAIGDVRSQAASVKGQDPNLIKALGVEEERAKAQARRLSSILDEGKLEREQLKKTEKEKLASDKKVDDERKRLAKEARARATRFAKERPKQAERRFAREEVERVGGPAGVRGIDKKDIRSVQAGLSDINKKSKIGIGRLRAVKRAMIAAGEAGTQKFKSVNKALGTLKTRARDAEVNLNAISNRMSKFGSVTQQTAALVRQFFRFAIGYGALFQGLNAVVSLTKSITGLEEALIGIQAVTQATDADMRTIEASIKQVALTTQFTTEEIAKAGRILGQAGVTPDEFPSTLGSVAAFASATQSSLEVSADLVTTMRNVFKELDDTTIANQLTKAVNISKLTADDLKTILSISAQTANKFGLASEQYLGAVSVLKDAGIKASTVATGLRRAANEIFSLDAKSVAAFRKRYKALGEDLSEEAIKARFFGFTETANPLVSALEELKRIGFAGSGKQELARTFDIRAVNVLTAAVENLEAIKKAEAEITFGSAAAEGAEVQLRSLNKSLDNLGAAFTVFGDSIAGEGVGSLESLVDAGTEAIRVVTELNDTLKATTGEGLGSSILPSVLAGIGTFSLSKASTPLRALKGLGVAGATGYGLTKAQESGSENAGEAVTNILTVGFFAQMLHGIFKSHAVQAAITKTGDVAAAGVTKFAGTALGASFFNKLFASPIVLSLLSLKNTLSTLFSATIPGRILKIGVVVAGTLGIVAAAFKSAEDTAEEALQKTRDKLRQAQKNVRSREAELVSAADALAEFDVDAVGGARAGTTAEAVNRITEDAKDISLAIDSFFEEQGVSVEKRKDQLLEFLKRTGGDAGAVNIEEAFTELYGFTGSKKDAFDLANKVEKFTVENIAQAEETLGRFRRLQDQIAERGEESLDATQKATIEGFRKVFTGEGGLQKLTELKSPEQADPIKLRETILELSQAVTEFRRKGVEEAQQALRGAGVTRAEALRGAVTTAGGDVAKIESALVSDLDLVSGSAKEVLTQYQVQINLLERINAADRERLKRLRGTGHKGRRADISADIAARKQVQDALEADIEAGRKAIGIRSKKLVGTAEDVIENLGLVLKTAEGELALQELGRLSPSKEKKVRGVLEKKAKEGIVDEKLTEDFNEALKFNTAQLRKTDPSADDAGRKQALTNHTNSLKEQASSIQKQIDLANSAIGDATKLPGLIAQQAEVNSKLIDAQFKRLTVEKKLTDSQANLVIAQQEQAKLTSLLLDQQRSAIAFEDKQRGIREKSEDLRGKATLLKVRPDASEAQKKRVAKENVRRQAVAARSQEFTKELRAEERLKSSRELLAKGGKGNLQEAIRKAEEAISIAGGLANSFAGFTKTDAAGKLVAEAIGKLKDIEQQVIDEQTTVTEDRRVKAFEDLIPKIDETKTKVSELDEKLRAMKLAIEEANGAPFGEQLTVKAGALVLQITKLNEELREAVRISAILGAGAGGEGGTETTETVDGVETKIKRQVGGTIPGYGGGDKVDALLEPGEEVIRKERGREFRDVLKVINNAPISRVRSLVSNIRQRFSAGGTVSPAGRAAASGMRSGRPVYLQLPSGESAGPLYGDDNAVTAFKRMLNNQARKTVRR